MFKSAYLILLMAFLFASCEKEQASSRDIQDFNFGWKFHLGDVSDPASPAIADETWEDVRLPHDWSIEHSYTQEDAAGATAFLPGGIGIYRKHFRMPKEAKDKVVWIEFDGVYTNSDVWINGHHLGKRPYGYVPFAYRLSPYLKYGEKENVIVVRADRSAYLDCRWYPGSGIYRKVKLVSTSKVFIPQWGTVLETNSISKESANVVVRTMLSNEEKTSVNGVLYTKIYDDQRLVGEVESSFELKGNTRDELAQTLTVQDPRLWDTDNPHLYKAISQVMVGGINKDEVSTRFGIREIRYDAQKGFFLNGKNTLFKGVCLHHDGGLVGAAVPKGVWRRRLAKLKEGGCNAIRTAHNPPSEEFLDLCDEMGFLVQDEAFDEWNNPKDKRNNYNQQKAEQVTRGYTEHFSEWAEIDIKSMVLRDRNHPSIVMWSIGNEIEWTYPRYGNATAYWGSNKVGDVNYYHDEPPLSIEEMKKNFDQSEVGKYELVPTAKNLSSWVREIDRTRPVTANLVIPSISNFSGYADALDVVGLSYRQAVYDYSHKNYPDKIFLGTENWARYHEWKPVLEKPYISGVFLWTGINYLGEAREWPSKGSGSGLLDFAGFEKASYHMFKTLWNDEPHVYITTQVLDKSPYKKVNNKGDLIEKINGWAAHQHWGWQSVNEHWNYKQGDEIAVEIYTNMPEVELFLNNSSLGTKKLSDNEDHIIKWMVPFQAGQLKAIGRQGSRRAEYDVLTTSNAATIRLSADKTELKSDAYDVSHLTAQVCDAEGNPITHQEFDLSFDVEGALRVLGVDNGSPSNVQDHLATKIRTHKGRCLLIVQSKFEKGRASIRVNGKDLESASVNLKLSN